MRCPINKRTKLCWSYKRPQRAPIPTLMKKLALELFCHFPVDQLEGWLDRKGGRK